MKKIVLRKGEKGRTDADCAVCKSANGTGGGRVCIERNSTWNRRFWEYGEVDEKQKEIWEE